LDQKPLELYSFSSPVSMVSTNFQGVVFLAIIAVNAASGSMLRVKTDMKWWRKLVYTGTL
jgi:hypothetical protein